VTFALLACLLLMGLLVVGLLAIPVDLLGRAAAGDELEARLRVEWLYGWLGRDISPPSKDLGLERSSSWPKRAQLELLLEATFRDHVSRLAKRLRRWVSIETLHGRLRFGFDSPADTGIALGWLTPLTVLADLHPKVSLSVEPDFAGAQLGGELDGWVRATPLGVLVAFLAFVLSPETIRTARKWRSLSG
jgi:hypothetical protein